MSRLAGLTPPWPRPYAKVMTGWDATVTSMAGVLGRDQRAALDEVALAKQRPYYDAAADGAAAEVYYADVSLDRLGDLLDSTHTVKPGYKPAQELYPWVDLQPDGKLRSLYTAQEFEPEARNCSRGLDLLWRCLRLRSPSAHIHRVQ